MMHSTKPDVLKLTQKLCLIDSTTLKERAICELVEEILIENDWDVIRQTVDEKLDRFNLLATRKGVSPSLILTTHLDTVPPFIAPTLSDDGKWLLGRGVCDAKGIAAAMLCAAFELVLEGINNVGLLFLVGEETNSDGAKKAAHNFVPQFDYLVNGEPTDLKLVSAMKGAVVFDLSVEGKAGHSAYPESGHSAIHQLVQDIHRLNEIKWPFDQYLGKTTLNIGKIKGGAFANVIASEACATGIIRSSVEASRICSLLKSTIAPTTKLEILSKSSPTKLETVEGLDTCVVSFGSDIPYLNHLGKCLQIGPGSILDAHTKDEKVKVKDLLRSISIYKDIVYRLLKH